MISFKASGTDFFLGNGTDVRVDNFRTKATIRQRGKQTDKSLTITATIHVTVEVDLPDPDVLTGGCHVCQMIAPFPVDEDALWFLIRNHDGHRLVFPDAEDCEDERDRYPVKGWRYAMGGLTCPDCYADFEAVRAKRRKKGAAA